MMQQRLTKQQAARVLGISSATLDRRIARGGLAIERAGRRVFVLIDREQSPERISDEANDEVEVVMLRERALRLEELVAYLKEQLRESDLRLQLVLQQLGPPRLPPPRRRWWRFGRG